MLADLSLRPAFADHFLTEYRLGRVDPVGLGASARFRLGDSGPWADTTIEATERPHLIREQGRTGRGNRVPTFTVWELAEGPSASSSELTVTFWTEPSHPIERAREMLRSSRRLRRNFKRALARLKRIAETGEPVARVGLAGEDRLPAFTL